MQQERTDKDILKIWRKLNGYKRNEIPKSEYETLEIIQLSRTIEAEENLVKSGFLTRHDPYKM